MTIEEARALIPPGWVECDYRKPGDVADYWKMAGYVSNGRYWEIYAIPAPKPEPRRVPMGNALVWLDNCGRPAISSYWSGMTELDKWKNEARELNAEIERLKKALDDKATRVKFLEKYFLATLIRFVGDTEACRMWDNFYALEEK